LELTVRTWNVFHGRTVPEGSRLYLEEMVSRITSGRPGVVCLQEVPAWALRRLGTWSGMGVFGSVAMRPLGGPAARRLTELDPRRLRSGLTGQANAILFDPELTPVERITVELNPPWFRAAEAERLALGRRERRSWARNRRIAQILRLEIGGTAAIVVNLHLTSPADSAAADVELDRAAAFAGSFAAPGEPVVLCGDLNLTARGSRVLDRLARAGYSTPCGGIDHILVRGLELVRGPEPWPDSARRRGDVLLSDHVPLEAAMIVP
jgi:endonuclease/exonuclease/phosphatase family metal-dependent hydrolase